jgi:hypothetical protein
MSDSMTDAEISSCESCLSTYVEGKSQVSASNCPAVNSFLCDAVSVCPCMSPCSVQYASYLECYLEAAAAQAGGDFTCDVNCGSNGSNGSASGAAVMSSLLVPALTGVLALASGLA